MRDFSLFEYALQCSAIDQTETTGQIMSISRRDFHERESFICHTNSTSVEYAFLLIEHSLLLQTNRAARVYSGVEKLSSLQPIIERYLRIADVSEAVYVFGEDDWQPPRHPHIRIVNLHADVRLARESFLISQSSTLNVAFVAFKETAADQTGSPQARYWAVKTSKASVVGRLTTALEDVIDWTLAA